MTINRDIGWNIAGSALPVVIGALTVPLMLRALGIERFGILTILWTIIGYASLFDLGLGRAATQQISARRAAGRTEVIQSIVKSAVILTACVGIAFGAALGLAANMLASRILHVSPGFVPEVRLALMIVAIGVPLATLSNGIRGVAEAYREFGKTNTAKIATGAAIFLFPMAGVVGAGGGLVEAAAALVAARFLGVIMFLLILRKLPRYPNSVPLSRSEVTSIVTSGSWMSLSSVVSPLLVNLDRFVIANVMGAAQVAYYTAPFEFLVRLLIVPAAVGSSLLPRLSAQHEVSPAVAASLFRRALGLTALLMGVLCVGCALVAFPLLAYATSAPFASKALPVVYVLLVGLFFNGMANIPYTALHASGAARFTGTVHIVELLAYVPLLFALVTAYGIVGAAFAWTLRTIADCAVLLYGYGRARAP